jgi:hypothetical protein
VWRARVAQGRTLEQAKGSYLTGWYDRQERARIDLSPSPCD